MARGDITIFNEAWEEALENWAGTDTIKCAVLDPTTAPTKADVSPALGSYTEVGTAGTYTAGGTSLGTWANFISQASNIITFDSVTNPSWAANASNDIDARWMLIYNDTQVGDPAFCFIDLGGNNDMTADALGATWNVSGIATITN